MCARTHLVLVLTQHSKKKTTVPKLTDKIIKKSTQMITLPVVGMQSSTTNTKKILSPIVGIKSSNNNDDGDDGDNNNITSMHINTNNIDNDLIANSGC